ncbi:MAG: O-antigen ligase family protein [Parvularculaceae bacterium]
MGAVILMVAASPLVFVFAHRGAAPLALALGAAVACRPSVWRAGVPKFLTRPLLVDPLVRAGLFFLAFCIWIAMTALWSPSSSAWKLALNAGAPVLAAGAIAWEIARRSDAELEPLKRVAEGSLVAATVLLLFEALSGGLLRDLVPPADQSLNRVKDMIALGRGVTALTTVLFAGLALIHRRGRSLWLSAALFAATYLAASRLQISANEGALVGAAFVFFAALRWPRAGVIALSFATLFALAAVPLAAALPVGELLTSAPDGAPISWLQRLVIWKTAGAEALQCLPWGCGAEYARDLSARAGEAMIPGASLPLPVLPIHPHNLFIEIWLELGIPGVVLFGGALICAADALLAARLSRLALAAVLATAASALVASLVETSLWQIWRHGAIVIAALFIALALRSGERVSPAPPSAP